MRLFISINLPPELHPYCRTLQNRFPGMRNVNEFHLTLQFLRDNIHEQFLPRLTEALGKIEFKPFVIKLGEARKFPNEDRPNGVWIDCDGGEALKDLADRIRKTMDKTGFRPDKPFAAHVTLGRYKKGFPTSHPLQEEEGDSCLPFSVGLLRRMKRRNEKRGRNEKIKSFTADRFLLMESHLSPEGSTYKTLAEFPSVGKAYSK